jgi:hypothetical protein
MQYKQAPRIAVEILESSDLSVDDRLKVIRMVMANKWPKLGPFKKRSRGQVLWRYASDSTRPAEERWQALQDLLTIVEEEAESNAKPEPVRNPDRASSLDNII